MKHKPTSPTNPLTDAERAWIEEQIHKSQNTGGQVDGIRDGLPEDLARDMAMLQLTIRAAAYAADSAYAETGNEQFGNVAGAMRGRLTQNGRSG